MPAACSCRVVLGEQSIVNLVRMLFEQGRNSIQGALGPVPPGMREGEDKKELRPPVEEDHARQHLVGEDVGYNIQHVGVEG